MRKYQAYLKAVVAILLFLGSFGTAGAEEVFTGVWPYEGAGLKPDPALHFGRLPNGLTYVVARNTTPKARVNMHLVVRAGSLNEADGERGIAHFLEHMVFCGSTHFKPGEIVHYFQKLGMEFGPDANAHTGFDETVYDLNLPDGSRASLDEALMVFRDFADGASLLQTEIDRERNVVLAEKRARDSASYRTFIAALAFEFPEHLISKRLPIGVEKDIDAVDAQSMRVFYETWYRPDHMTLVIVGDLQVQETIDLIQSRFGDMKPKREAVAAPDPGKVIHTGVEAFYHHEPEAGSTSVSIENPRQIDPVPDSRQALFERAAAMLASQVVQNRLDARKDSADTPFTSSAISQGIFLKNIYYSQISAETDPDKWRRALQTIERELRGALEKGFSDAETERVKADYLAELDKAAKQAETEKSDRIASRIMRDLSEHRVTLSAQERLSILSPFVSGLKASDLQNAIRKVWHDDARLIEVTGNLALPELGKQAILQAYHESLSMPPVLPVAAAEIGFPYLPEPLDTGIIAQHDTVSDLGVYRIQYENGVRLALKPTPFREKQILIQVVFGPGSSGEPADKPGLSLFAADLIRESGTATLSQTDLERALSGKTTRIAFGIQEDRFVFGGETIPQELPTLFQLLYARLTDPGFRKQAADRVIQRYRQRMAEYRRSIEGTAAIQARRFFAGGNPRFGLIDEETFSKYTVTDVRDWLEPWFQSGVLDVAIVGDFDLAEVHRLASRYLGSLPAREMHPAATVPAACMPVFPKGKSLELRVETAIPKSLVMVGFPTTDYWNMAMTRKLNMLTEIFSDRMRERIREKLGAAYSPSAFHLPSKAYPGYGYIQSFVQTKPADIQLIDREIGLLAGGFSKHPITRKEWVRAINPVMTSIREMIKTNEYWLNSVLAGLGRRPEQLHWARTIETGYSGIRLDELNVLAKRYLDPSRRATLIVTPAS
ncbi:M16 family metallopeptidase [Desulfatirhabdium butyrativorans]|uniref:M16 family metallopeptidase n=1 Tax=Desulfatirhabdium butyrativorans TaxID=340467 RepID=UPI00042A63DE|nr:M16 family metallopeptidase [Desulfatirhabdium butyrativorans]